MSVTRDEIPPTEGGRGIPRTCCGGAEAGVSLVSEIAEDRGMSLNVDGRFLLIYHSNLTYCGQTGMKRFGLKGRSVVSDHGGAVSEVIGRNKVKE